MDPPRQTDWTAAPARPPATDGPPGADLASGSERSPESDRARGRIPRDRVLVALAVLLGIGFALRVWFTLAWRPALTGYSDTGIYFTGAVRSLWSDPIRTVGYSMFLRVLHAISPHLILVTLVQHALGLGAAVLFFLAVRRCGGPRGLGLVPAAVIALGGDELFLEHAALSDALFIFLLSAMLYCAVRALDGGARWAALGGLSIGLGVWDRGAGLVMAALIPLWLLFSAGRPTRRTLTAGALTLVVALAAVGAYAGWRHAASGKPGLLTSNNAYNLYARVAPWADCTKFTPPVHTRRLCQTTPPARRGHVSGETYIYYVKSPAYRLFGPAYFVSRVPHAMELLTNWSEAAVAGQPLDYLHAVWLDTIRLFDPNHHSYGDLSADDFVALLLYGPTVLLPGPYRHSGKNELVEYWEPRLYPHDPRPHRGDVAALKEWERITRVDGVWMGLLLALCLAGPWLLAGRPRSGMILFALSGLALLFFPILVKGYDYRFVIPAFAPLLAAGALAAWGLAVRIKAKPRAARLLGRVGAGRVPHASAAERSAPS